MIFFATSDKGGTGRSVTSSNLVYRRAISGSDVAYLDFDFGSPTAGAIFDVPYVRTGTPRGGMHAFLRGASADPHRVDVWNESDRLSRHGQPDGAGQLCLLPGDVGGGEFAADPQIVARCVQLFLRMEDEFEISLVDLSAGRSYANSIVLAATADPAMRHVISRWLVFHRWTHQHIIAAHGLVFGERGIIDIGRQSGHDATRLSHTIKFVRTAVVNPNSDELAGLRAPQVAWLREYNTRLLELASSRQVGRRATLGSVPLDPVLQWREQLISDADVVTRPIANPETVRSFEQISRLLTDEETWEVL
jgi:hypothetical protein